MTKCVVEVGRHPGPFWKERNSGITVCSRHRSQYEERADEFGPFDWVELPTDLDEVERLWEQAFRDVGTSTLAYRALVAMPALIASHRATLKERDALLDEVGSLNGEVSQWKDAVHELEAEVVRLTELAEEYRINPA